MFNWIRAFEFLFQVFLTVIGVGIGLKIGAWLVTLPFAWMVTSIIILILTLGFIIVGFLS